MSKRRHSETDESSLDSWELNKDDSSVTVLKENMAKDLKEAEKQERKAKAFESIQKLLSVSEKYSSIWMKRFEDVKGIGRKSVSKELSDEYVDFNNMKYFTGTLRPYQLEGVEWMRTLCMGGINGILADEMGLGKTVQIIALLSHFLEKKMTGPHLIIGPLSTIINWKNEFKRFSPKFPVTVFHGMKPEWDGLMQEVQKVYKVDNMYVKPVVITDYNSILRKGDFLRKIKWKYIVVDEAQRIKNHNSQLSVMLRTFSCMNKLLLTGTPLQNNMTELWALLNFIMPQIFNNVDAFASLFDLEDMQDKQILNDKSENNTIIATIHKVLSPFMLRRLKKDVLSDSVPKKEVLVYCPMTKTQSLIYRAILMKNANQIKRISGIEVEEEGDLPLAKRKCSRNVTYTDTFEEGEEFFPLDEYEKETEREKVVENLKNYYFKIKLQNPMLMFKKAVNHPYLINVPIIPGTREMVLDERLISISGKLLVLDAMLAKLKEKGHKVLIFSTFVMMLDLIEDFLIMRDYSYGRLDGNYSLEARQTNIDEFNNDPNQFVFLISTRAGGLGINLTSADTVIFYDRDWNPQVDCQAQDRCHRIGQTKPVMIYTLVTKNTIDERIINCGKMKRRLEKLIIKDGKFQMKTKYGETQEHSMEELLKLLESESSVVEADQQVFTDDELEKLLDRSELYRELEAKK